MPRKGSLPWRRDAAILARLVKVERAHLRGDANTTIGSALGVTEATIRNDLERIHELWLKRTGDQVNTMRARVVAELEDERQRALAAAEFDEHAERAVLFGQDADGAELIVERDMKGSVQFRGNKSGAIKAAIDASLGKAKVLGLIIEKQEHSGEVLIRRYIGVDVDDV